MLLGVFLLVSFVSYLFNWQEDQSQLAHFTDKKITVKNLLGKIGASISHLFIYNGVGIIVLYFPILLFFSGMLIFLKGNLRRIRKSWGWGILGMIWFSTTFGFFAHKNALLAGVVGYELNMYLQQFLGKIGLFLTLLFLFISYLVIRYKLTPEVIKNSFPKSKKGENDSVNNEITETTSENIPLVNEDGNKAAFELSVESLKPTTKDYSTIENPLSENKEDIELDINVVNQKEETEDVEIVVEQNVEEKHFKENLSGKLVKDFGEFDPTLEVVNYTFPT